MNCPNCDTFADRQRCRILQSRNDTIETKLRQRFCTNCEHRWWTVEAELPAGAVKWVRRDDPDLSAHPLPIRQAGFKRVSYS